MTILGGPKTRDHNSVNINRFKKKFTGRLLGNFADKQISQLPPHLAYVAALPRETLVSAKKPLTTNYKVVYM